MTPPIYLILTSCRIEMNVGIIAACLPTLKPLAAGFFGAVSALTSGERYGSRGHTTGRFRPQASGGYLKQSEGSGTQSYDMDHLKRITARTTPESPYMEDYSGRTVTYKAHGRKESLAGQSDESVLPLQKGIIKTTEVEVT
jgi:hypothetical protein